MLFISLHKENAPIAKKRLRMVIYAITAATLFYVVQISGLFRGVTNVFDVTIIGYTVCTTFMYIAILRCDLLGTGELAREVMVDRLPEGIIAVDNAGMVQYFNEPAKKLFPDLETGSGTVPPAVPDTIATGGILMQGDCIFRVEQTELIRGSEHYGILYDLVDETEHFRYMEALEEQKELADSANQAKSAFLANMSHDIRTPINAVLGMNEMIMRECEDEQILDYSAKIRSAGGTLLGLINDILDFSKIEAGKLDIIPLDYDLASVLNDLVSMMQPRAEAKGLKLETKVDGGIPKLLHGDEIRIKQIAALDAGLGELLKRGRLLVEHLSPLLKEDDLPLIAEEELQEAYTLIREFLSVEDYESAMQVIEGLGAYSFPENEKQRVDALKKAALEFDYDEMSKIMGE